MLLSRRFFHLSQFEPAPVNTISRVIFIMRWRTCWDLFKPVSYHREISREIGRPRGKSRWHLHRSIASRFVTSYTCRGDCPVSLYSWRKQISRMAPRISGDAEIRGLHRCPRGLWFTLANRTRNRMDALPQCVDVSSFLAGTCDRYTSIPRDPSKSARVEDTRVRAHIQHTHTHARIYIYVRTHARTPKKSIKSVWVISELTQVSILLKKLFTL